MGHMLPSTVTGFVFTAVYVGPEKTKENGGEQDLKEDNSQRKGLE